MLIDETQIRSKYLHNQRRIWLQRPNSNVPTEFLCILLDGEYYVERMDVPAVFNDLDGTGSIPPVSLAYVSHVDAVTRWPESFCNPTFARFIDAELIPWLLAEFWREAPAPKIILGGLSLTGLAAAHATLHSEKISAAICQSASFWWSDNWLVQVARRQRTAHARFRIVVGTNETDEYVEHGPELIQRSSQLSSNRAMRNALIESGHVVSYEEFDGGHDLASWKSDLPRSLSTICGAVR